MTEKMTARALGCSVDNVKNIRAAVFYKLHAPNITAAVAECFKRGHLKYIPALFLCIVTAIGTAGEARPVRRPYRTVSIMRVVSSRVTV